MKRNKEKKRAIKKVIPVIDKETYLLLELKIIKKFLKATNK